MVEYYCPNCRRKVKTLSGTGWTRGHAQPRCPKCHGYVGDVPINYREKRRLPATWDELAFQADVDVETLKRRAIAEGVPGAESATAGSAVSAGVVELAKGWFASTWITWLEWDD